MEQNTSQKQRLSSNLLSGLFVLYTLVLVLVTYAEWMGYSWFNWLTFTQS